MTSECTSSSVPARVPSRILTIKTQRESPSHSRAVAWFIIHAVVKRSLLSCGIGLFHRLLITFAQLPQPFNVLRPWLVRLRITVCARSDFLQPFHTPNIFLAVSVLTQVTEANVVANAQAFLG